MAEHTAYATITVGSISLTSTQDSDTSGCNHLFHGSVPATSASRTETRIHCPQLTRHNQHLHNGSVPTCGEAGVTGRAGDLYPRICTSPTRTVQQQVFEKLFPSAAAPNVTRCTKGQGLGWDANQGVQTRAGATRQLRMSLLKEKQVGRSHAYQDT